MFYHGDPYTYNGYLGKGAVKCGSSNITVVLGSGKFACLVI